MLPTPESYMFLFLKNAGLKQIGLTLPVVKKFSFLAQALLAFLDEKRMGEILKALW